MSVRSSSQPIARQGNLTCDKLRDFGTRLVRRGEDVPSLFAQGGQRKYLNTDERKRVLVAMRCLPTDRHLFCELLAITGARISESLALTIRSIDIHTGLVAIVTLKRRRFVVRQVPIPRKLLRALIQHFKLRALQKDDEYAATRLWPWCRMTAYRVIKRVMASAGVVGIQASPKGLRHSFGVHAAQKVPITLVQRWLGHARLETTNIYLDVSGPEEIAFAQRIWQDF